MKFKFLSENNNKLFLNIFTFISIYLSRDSIIVLNVIGFLPSQVIFISIYCLSVVVFFIKNKRNFKNIMLDYRMFSFGFLMLNILFVVLIKRDYMLLYGSTMIAISVPFFLSFIFDFEDIADSFIKVVFLLSIFSLLSNHLFRSLIFANRHLFMIFKNNSNIEFINLWGSVLLNVSSYYRNFGIFREPGVFQFFLTTGLLLELMISKRNRVLKNIIIVVFVLAMVSTFSTNGYLQLILLFFVYLAIQLINKNYDNLIRIALSFMVILSGVYYLSSKNINIRRTLLGALEKLSNPMNISTMARLESLTYNIKLFIMNPLFGNPVKVILEGIENNTSSTLVLFSLFGFSIGIISIVMIFLFTKHVIRNIFEDIRQFKYGLLFLIIFALVMMSINSQTLIASVYFWMFPILATMEEIDIIMNNYKKIG